MAFHNFVRIDVTVAIELFEQFVLNTFAGQVVTKPIPNMCPSSYQQASLKNFQKTIIIICSYLHCKFNRFALLRLMTTCVNLRSGWMVICQISMKTCTHFFKKTFEIDNFQIILVIRNVDYV